MNTQVKVGDYIEGYELWGYTNYRSIHRTRVIVENIRNYNGRLSYYGQADDCYNGARATTISEEFGNIKVITGEQPFSSRWWDKSNNISYSLEKEWQLGGIIKKYDNTLYKLLNIGINTETNEQVMIYCDLTDPSKIYSEPRELFESLNNENDEQIWRFEALPNDLGGNYGS